MKTNRRPLGLSGILVATGVIVAACTSQLVGTPGGPGSTVTASNGAPPSGVGSMVPTDSGLTPSSGAPGGGAGGGLGSPGASSLGASGGGGSGGIAPSGPLVCPAEPTGVLGAICAPASDVLLVSAAAAILTTAERAAGTGGWMIHGAAPCATSPPPVGCAGPNTAQGEVIIEFQNPAPAVHILVFRRPDGSLGATRLG